MKPIDYPDEFLDLKINEKYLSLIISKLEDSSLEIEIKELLGDSKTTTLLQVYEASRKLSKKRNKEAKQLGDELSNMVKECFADYAKLYDSTTIKKTTKSETSKAKKNLFEKLKSLSGKNKKSISILKDYLLREEYVEAVEIAKEINNVESSNILFNEAKKLDKKDKYKEAFILLNGAKEIFINNKKPGQVLEINEVVENRFNSIERRYNIEFNVDKNIESYGRLNNLIQNKFLDFILEKNHRGFHNFSSNENLEIFEKTNFDEDAIIKIEKIIDNFDSKTNSLHLDFITKKVEKMPEELHIDFALKLIDLRKGNLLEENLNRFTGIPKENYNFLALELIKSGEEWVVESNVEKFNLDSSKVDELISFIKSNFEKNPKFIRDFSKEKYGEERKELLNKIKQKRKEHFENKKIKEQTLSEKKESISNRNIILQEKIEELKNLSFEIEEIKSNFLKKYKNYKKLKKMEAELIFGEKKLKELIDLQNKEISEQKTLSKLIETSVPIELYEVKMMLNDFYNEQKEKWIDSEYDKEEITKLFSEKHLSSLSLEEYILLLQKFPSEMVTHVTRQGIRDHTGMVWHTGGADEFANGFIDMLEDGCLRDTVGITLLEKEQSKAIEKFLLLEAWKTKEEAIEQLNIRLNDLSEAGSYTDKKAIHFAVEEVPDIFYGSEKGNEIFVIYPSLHIASQYYFRGSNLTEASGGQWNDLFVWSLEDKGMDLNAGIVFIPLESMVDKNTGSRYEIKDNKPTVNEDYISQVRNFVDSNDFEKFAQDLIKIKSSKYNEQDLKPLREKLEEYNIIDERIQNSILKYSFCNSILNPNSYMLDINPDFKREYIKESLKEEGILFVEAKDTITSKEYWENYFEKNPEQKPSKIVYYRGSNPTRALYDWREKNNISKKSKEKDLGFSERIISSGDERLTKGMERFKSLALKVIDDYYK